MKILRARLFELEQRKKRKPSSTRLSARKGYRLGQSNPFLRVSAYQMVKDHRTGHEVGGVRRHGRRTERIHQTYLQRKMTGGKAPEPIAMKDDRLLT